MNFIALQQNDLFLSALTTDCQKARHSKGVPESDRPAHNGACRDTRQICPWRACLHAPLVEEKPKTILRPGGEPTRTASCAPTRRSHGPADARYRRPSHAPGRRRPRLKHSATLDSTACGSRRSTFELLWRARDGRLEVRPADRRAGFQKSPSEFPLFSGEADGFFAFIEFRGFGGPATVARAGLRCGLQHARASSFNWLRPLTSLP